MRRWIWLPLIVLVAAAVAVYLNWRTPAEVYFESGIFAACPKRPSCVSSLATDDLHRVAALGYTSDDSTAYAMLHELVQRMGGRIENESPGYIHAEFVSARLHLRDDLELLIVPGGRVEVRSISRISWYDRGGNRARVEDLRRAFETQP